MERFLSGPLGILFMIAGPVTYILNVVDTWQSSSSVIVKLLINLTLDAFLAFIWPITWVLWLFWEMAGRETPLSTVLGF